MSWTQEDKDVAEKAAATLTRLQGKADQAAVQEIEQPITTVQNSRTDEHERAAAWLSICALAEKMTNDPNDASLPALWSNAIKNVNGWRGSMK